MSNRFSRRSSLDDRDHHRNDRDGDRMDAPHRGRLEVRLPMSNRGPYIMLGGVSWGENRYPGFYYREGRRRWFFSIHRLNAYAHGIIDHPRFESEDIIAIDGQNGDEMRIEPDPREVHHIDEDKMNCDPENLVALEPDHHAWITNGGSIEPEGEMDTEPIEADGGRRECEDCSIPLLPRMERCPKCEARIP